MSPGGGDGVSRGEGTVSPGGGDGVSWGRGRHLRREEGVPSAGGGVRAGRVLLCRWCFGRGGSSPVTMGGEGAMVGGEP